LKAKLRGNVKKIIADQMRLNENASEEGPNINLRALFINKEDSIEKQEEISDLLEDVLQETY